jgi:hypothetical protein
MPPKSAYHSVEFGSLLARYVKTHHVFPGQFDITAESFLRRFLERFPFSNGFLVEGPADAADKVEIRFANLDRRYSPSSSLYPLRPFMRD